MLTVLNVLTSSNMSISCSVFVAFHTKLSVPRSCVLKFADEAGGGVRSHEVCLHHGNETMDSRWLSAGQ